MKKTDWIDVIGKIDPAYVKEAEQWSKAAQKKRNLRHFTAMAACVCIPVSYTHLTLPTT